MPARSSAAIRFFTRRDQLVALASRHVVPASYTARVRGGRGPISYGRVWTPFPSQSRYAGNLKVRCRPICRSATDDLDLVVNLRPPRRSAHTAATDPRPHRRVIE
jgi:hypothetical protein